MQLPNLPDLNVILKYWHHLIQLKVESLLNMSAIKD